MKKKIKRKKRFCWFAPISLLKLIDDYAKLDFEQKSKSAIVTAAVRQFFFNQGKTEL